MSVNNPSSSGSSKIDSKKDVTKMTLPELRDTLSRLKKLSSSKTIKNLPDKGAKIPDTIRQVEELIKKKETESPPLDQQINSHAIDWAEWANSRGMSEPISYLYTPVCKNTEETIEKRGNVDVFEGLTKSAKSTKQEDMMDLSTCDNCNSIKPKWDESLLPRSANSKSKEIGIKESLELIKESLEKLKANKAEPTSTSDPPRRRTVHFENEYENVELDDLPEEEEGISEYEEYQTDPESNLNIGESLMERIENQINSMELG